MNRPFACVSLLAALAAATVASPLQAQPDGTRIPINQRAVVRDAASNNPSLRAALWELKRAQSLLYSAQDQYPLVLTLDAGATHLRSPSLALDGVETSTTDNVVLGAQLSKTFPWGTGIIFRTEGSWTDGSSERFPELGDIGPGYGISSRLTVLQPLLRGAGTDVGEAEVRNAEIERTGADRTRERVASELLRDVLTAYWELWYADESERIDIAARQLAENERKQQQDRIDAGANAPAEIYPFVTRVAELDEAVLLARLQREEQALQLGLRLGRPGSESRHLASATTRPPSPKELAPEKELLAQAMSANPELHELDAQIAAAEEQTLIAGENERQRLDLEGWVQLEGLGNARVPPALEQYATFGAFSAHIGLVYELPLTGDRYAHQKSAARAAVGAASERREAVRQQIQNDLVILLNRADAARERVDLAKRTEKSAEAQRIAAKDRYELGDGVAIEIQRAEDLIRTARLRGARARIDWILAAIAIDHLTGRLLSRHTRDIPTTTGPTEMHGVDPGPY